jgi:thymidylate synthase (FAD)
MEPPMPTSPLESFRTHHSQQHNNTLTWPVLERGFVRVVDLMGDDDAVVQAARVSYGEGTKTAREDRGLIDYLMEHRHTSPFEMNVVKLHLKMPIFVARQWIRHRTASINEYSARYSVVKDEFYIPDVIDIARQSIGNKQGRDVTYDDIVAYKLQHDFNKQGVEAFKTYDFFINQESVARELARIVLPLSTYTEFYWKIDLHNLLHFLELRLDPHAQLEIRRYADVIWNNVVKPWVPLTAASFTEHRLEALHLARTERDEVLRLARIGARTSGMTTEHIQDLNLTKRRAKRLIELLELERATNAATAGLPGAPAGAEPDARGTGTGIAVDGGGPSQGELCDRDGPEGTGNVAPQRTDVSGRPVPDDGIGRVGGVGIGEVENVIGERGS